MSIKGLGKSKQPYQYLDEYVQMPDWEKLHAEVCWGISQSEWNKKFVSSGVHADWAHQEITPFLMNWEKNLSVYEKEFFLKCATADEKLKFLTALKYIPHPFWSLFIRFNRRVERTGVRNKSVGADCDWTDNAQHFPTLVEFIKKLPFSEIGRVMLFMTEANNQTVPHYDDIDNGSRPNDDFIWFTTKPGTKKIFVFDNDTKEKFYTAPDKKLVWFNEFDWHGTDPTDHFSFSVRIDGKFTPEVKKALSEM